MKDIRVPVPPGPDPYGEWLRRNARMFRSAKADCWNLDQLFREPVTRPDVTARHEANKHLDFLVVKCSYKSFCRQKTRGCLYIDSICRNLNKMALEAHNFANLHILRLLDEGIELPELSQAWFYSCCAAVSGNTNAVFELQDPEMRVTRKLYDSCKPPHYRRPTSDFSGALMNDLSTQIATETKNAAVATLYLRLKRYLRHFADCSGAEAHRVLVDLFKPESTSQDPYLLHLRSLFDVVPTKSAVEADPRIPLRAMHTVLRHFEGAEACRGTRLFTILPTKQGFRCSHIKIGNAALHDILVSAGVERDPDFMERKRLYWSRLFDVERFERSGKSFGYEIVTDGRAVSVLLTRPRLSPKVKKRQKKVKKKEDPAYDCTGIDLDSYSRVLGLDPGRRDLFVATDGDGDVTRCSSRRYYHEAGFTRTQRTMRTWYDQDLQVQSWLRTMTSAKTGSVRMLLEHFRNLFPKIDPLLDFHLGRKFRDKRFTRFCGSKRVIHRLCKAITKGDGEKTLVGFGDWSNLDTGGFIQGAPAGPVNPLKRELRRHCKVVSVDEHLTSKLCQFCGQRTRNMMRRVESEGSGGGVRYSQHQVHSVLHCGTNGCRGTTMNRDVNGASNILQVFLSVINTGERPERFSREREV